jgi:hypothetical protein
MFYNKEEALTLIDKIIKFFAIIYTKDKKRY